MTSKRHATRIEQSNRRHYIARITRVVNNASRSQIVGVVLGFVFLALGLSNSNANNPQPTIDSNSISSISIEKSREADESTKNPRKVFSIDLTQEKQKADRTAIAQATEDHSGQQTPTRPAKPTSPAMSFNATEKTSAAEATLNVNSLTATATDGEVIGPPSPFREVSHRIKSGENLSEVFASVGLSQRDVYEITSSGEQGKALTRMFPGETLTFSFRDDQLHSIVRQKNPLESVHFTLSGDSYSSEIKTRTPEIRQVSKSGIVNHSLSRAAEKAGLPQSTTMNMANIFGGVMDFALDVRGGDRFTVVYEEHYLDGKKIKDGNIIAAQYTNRGTQHNAYRYIHNDGRIGYYNEDGVSLRRAFLRAPLDFTRVSSNFNLKRLHPITKKVKPHRGIDYAAPTGTPVFSVGEGRVIASGYSSANGKYVFIKHGEAYTTKYLHLHKRSVKKGQRVKQGQIIGQVGCTGLCTGPHLHYEFLWNGVHRNPRTIVNKLPKAKQLDANELPAFSVATASAQNILSHYSAQFELASNQ